MTYETFNSELFRRFPRLKETSDIELYYFGDEVPGCYVIFEGVLVPEIERASGEDPEYLATLMAFVEEVAVADNTCYNLVSIGLGERLPSSKNEDAIRATAGPMTQKAIWKAERYRVQAERNNNWSPFLSFVRRLVRPKGKAKC